MDGYLEDLNYRLQSETIPVYKTQLKTYAEFIRSLITDNKLLTRHFYIIIPFRPTDNKAEFDLIREQLKLRIDIIAKGMARLGMRADQLDSLEVLDLFYSFYSPVQAKIQPLTERALQTIHTALIRDGSEIE